MNNCNVCMYNIIIVAKQQNSFIQVIVTLTFAKNLFNLFLVTNIYIILILNIIEYHITFNFIQFDILS